MISIFKGYCVLLYRLCEGIRFGFDLRSVRMASLITRSLAVGLLATRKASDSLLRHDPGKKRKE